MVWTADSSKEVFGPWVCLLKLSRYVMWCWRERGANGWRSGVCKRDVVGVRRGSRSEQLWRRWWWWWWEREKRRRKKVTDKEIKIERSTKQNNVDCGGGIL